MAEFEAEHGVLRGAADRMGALVEGRSGAPLAEVGASGEAGGDPAFAAALAGFCERWGGGIDALCERTRTMSAELGEAADAWRAADAAGGAALGSTRAPGR